jgi:hypothetical protein
MHFLEIMIRDCEWLGKNFAHNLDFVPDDKLNWKPAPTAKSALEITAEVLGVFSYTRAQFETAHGEVQGDFSVPTTRAEAKAKILSTTQSYADFLLGFTPEDLEGDLVTPVGPFSKIRAALLPVRDLNHNHGQLAYLQSIWGDTEPHFFEFGS